MADITCARCGHEEPLHACDKCSDSDTRYCSMDCMRAHAEIHKPICDTAGCFVLGTNQCDEVADESPTCLVCFESGGTMPCGCACRGSAGWAHARCIAKAAEHAVNPEAAYHTCRICKQSYSGPMNLEIARARFRMVRRFDTQDDVSAAVHLARACNQRGIEDVSMTLYRKAIELQIELSGEMSIKAAEVWQGFGQLFLNSMTGEPADAIDALEKAMSIYEALHDGDDNGDVASCLLELAEVHAVESRETVALELYERSLAMQKRLAGDRHEEDLDIAYTIKSMAHLRRDMGMREEALELYSQASRIEERAMGIEDEACHDTRNFMGVLQAELGNTAEALQIHREALRRRERIFGSEHYLVGAEQSSIADVLVKEGKEDEALELYGEALRKYEACFGAIAVMGIIQQRQASIYTKQGRVNEARAKFESARGIYEQVMPVGCAMREATMQLLNAEVAAL